MHWIRTYVFTILACVFTLLACVFILLAYERNINSCMRVCLYIPYLYLYCLLIVAIILIVLVRCKYWLEYLGSWILLVCFQHLWSRVNYQIDCTPKDMQSKWLSQMSQMWPFTLTG